MLAVIAPELQTELRTARYQAAYLQRDVLTSALPVVIEGSTRHVTVLVRPARGDLELGVDHFLIVFDESSETVTAERASAAVPTSESDAMLQLGKELAALRGQLRLTLELHDAQAGDLTASNEEQQESNLFRIMQEALNNVRKHARARSVDVRLRQRDGTLLLTIADDGAGFDASAERTGTSGGLIGMQERALLVNGTVDIESTMEGTRVLITPPAVLMRSEGAP